DPFTPAGVPDVTGGGRGHIAVRIAVGTSAFGKVLAAPFGVVDGPDFFRHVGRVGSRRKGVSGMTDLGVDEEVVEEDELPGERVCIGRDLLAEKAEIRITVALLLVSQDLVVGAVFTDHIEDMANG